MHKVMVYGSLKKGWWNNRLLETSKLIETKEVEVEGCVLRCNKHDSFPFLHKDNSQASAPFVAEIWEVDDDTLARLDCLEGHPDFYTRQAVPELGVETYVYQHNIADKKAIYNFGEHANEE